MVIFTSSDHDRLSGPGTFAANCCAAAVVVAAAVVANCCAAAVVVDDSKSIDLQLRT